MSKRRRQGVRTIFNGILNIHNQVDKPYVPIVGSSLNELYNIPSLLTSSPYSIGHFIIGLQPYDINNGGYVDLGLKEHQCYDGNVYTPIPIFMKRTTETITTLERSTYKLFTTKRYNNIDYYVAYAKRLEDIESIGNPSWITHDVTNGYDLFALESRDLDYLNPTVIDETLTYPDVLKYISYSLELSLTLTEEELINIRSYIDIIYPTRTGTSKYTISEVGLLQSQHVSLDSTVEIYNSQVAYFTYLSMKDMVGNNIELSIEIGDMSPVQV